jgi:hypothetical protein
MGVCDKAMGLGRGEIQGKEENCEKLIKKVIISIFQIFLCLAIWLEKCRTDELLYDR